MASLPRSRELVVVLDHPLARLRCGVGVDPEPLDPEVVTHRAPDPLLAERRELLEFVEVSGGVTHLSSLTRGYGQGMSTAELIVRCLETEGVEYVFGIPGEENIHLIQALSGSSIRYVLVRHEQAASFMAEIYGRLTGRAGVCSATLGPGAINLLLGTADATTNSTPLVALAAQGARRRMHKESPQVIDLVSMFAPGTPWAGGVECPDAVPEMVRKAFKTAQSERPGAVFLAVPEDIETEPPAEPLAPLQIDVVRSDAPSPSQIARAADVLTGARRPVVL